MPDDYGEPVCWEDAPTHEMREGEETDFVFLWASKLNGDTIATSDFELPDGLTEESSSNTTTTATIFVSGGLCGRLYRITNEVTTAGGRTWKKTYYVKVTV